jgi:subtilisin family serine protease
MSGAIGNQSFRKGAALGLALALSIASTPASARDFERAPPAGGGRGAVPVRGYGPAPILGGHRGLGGWPGRGYLPVYGGGPVYFGPPPGAFEPSPPVEDSPPPPPPRHVVKTPPPPLRTRVAASHGLPPPPGENRYRAHEVLVETAPGASPAAIAEIARRHGLVEVETRSLALIGVSLRLWRIPDRRDVATVTRELGTESALSRAQPNYLYRPVEDSSEAAAPEQYSLAKLHVDVSLLTSGASVRVAVIDTAIDESHPDLAGVVEEKFDAIGGKAKNLEHGTSIAGAIAGRGRVRGVAPNVRILSARAFDSDGAGGAIGSSETICESLEWAFERKARVVNMSFAGPSDPLLHDAIASAYAKGMTLVGAAGNAGPKSPPLYPGADDKVIAITATDADDKRYDMANVGGYIAASAPGVDVVLPAPAGGYAMETGTSVSAALVSGVVALMLEHRPAMTPADVRKLITSTASPLGGAGHAAEFGAGLVDAERAVKAAGR